MRARMTALLLLAFLLLPLCGCSGSVYDKEYVNISPYRSAEQGESSADGRVVVRNFAALKKAILQLVSSEKGQGIINFDSSYEGNAVEDMASACWQVRSQDALCAYCVENIAYEMSKIVNYYEAEVSVTYSRAIENAGGILRMQYATGLDETIREALGSGRRKLVLLIDRSSYTAEDMESIVEREYRAGPEISPRLPRVEVNLYSGNEMQKLFEINLSYGMSDGELQRKRIQVQQVQPFADMETEEMSAVELAELACRYLTANCLYQAGSGRSSVYEALVEGEADSEGLSYAYVTLCRQLGLNCRMIYGQYEWQEHWWNMVEIDGSYYHVDVSRCMDGDFSDGFLLNDESIWGTHRWDVSSYPKCSGEPLFAADIQE